MMIWKLFGALKSGELIKIWNVCQREKEKFVLRLETIICRNVWNNNSEVKRTLQTCHSMSCSKHLQTQTINKTSSNQPRIEDFTSLTRLSILKSTVKRLSWFRLATLINLFFSYLWIGSLAALTAIMLWKKFMKRKIKLSCNFALKIKISSEKCFFVKIFLSQTQTFETSIIYDSRFFPLLRFCWGNKKYVACLMTKK